MSNQKEATETTVAKINNVSIVVIENGEKRIAVKPICEALGVAYQSQIERLKNDPILSSVIMLSVTTGADGKRYEMVTIPFKFVFGWLFRIDSRNVKEEARETVLRYQMECYDVLYNHFKSYMDFNDYRLRKIAEVDALLAAHRADFNQAKERMKKAQQEKDEIWAIDFEEWTRRQTTLDFDARIDEIEESFEEI